MKTDSLFYKLFQQAPELVFELVNLEYSPDQKYQFRSEEIKQTSFRLDGVMTPPADQPDLAIVFVEVQFQLDKTFYSRFFSEIFLYLRQNEPANPWQAVIIYSSRAVESSGTQQYSDLLSGVKVKRIYLEDIIEQTKLSVRANLVQLIALSNEKVPQATKSLLKQIDNDIVIVDNKRQILEMLETILVYKLPLISREEIQKMLGYNDISLKQTRFYQDVFAEGLLEGKVTGIQEGMQVGRQEGRQVGMQEGRQVGMQEGRQVGRQEGEGAFLLKQLSKRFGALPNWVLDRIGKANVEQLETWGIRIFEAESLEELFSNQH